MHKKDQGHCKVKWDTRYQ